jgi:hypothetical protein
MIHFVLPLLALILGAVVGSLVPVEAFMGSELGMHTNTRSLTYDTGMNTFSSSARQRTVNTANEDALKNYQCNLGVDHDGFPKCSLGFNESEGSKGSDVKCKPIQDARSTVSGSYNKTGSIVADEGRLRSNPDNLNQCDILPTDTLMYPRGAEFPMCSDANPNLFDRSQGHGRVVKITEDTELGRCNIDFLTESKADILNYSLFLDKRAKEADLLAANAKLSMATTRSKNIDYE